MKILWITNIVFPEAMSELVENADFKSSGGWMLGAAKALIDKSDIQLIVASVSPLVNQLTKIQGEKILYYIIPYGKGNLKENPEYQSYWVAVNSEVKPDVVHIHGTEYSHGHAYMKACGVENVVISIQGLKSAISSYYLSGISKCDIYRNITPRDILRGTILREQRNFRRSAKYETAMLQMAKHIIGRTSWDRSRALAVNPDLQYHFCNEILRGEFYDGSLWHYEKCNKHTIFLSQAGYPIKGLHQLLKAMPLILRYYPDTKVRIAGSDITKSATFNDLVHFTGYGLYIKRLIKKYHLQDKICFTGNLNAEEMKQEYLRSNVFVCPSSIENSPNSLGEAQILGVPCVASYVGGIPDMMRGNEDNLYRFEDIEMLAAKICEVFEYGDNKTNMIRVALSRHNAEANNLQLVSIYNEINENI